MPDVGQNKSDRNVLQRVVGWLVQSRLMGWLVNLPPISWVVRAAARSLAKRQIGGMDVEHAPVYRTASLGLESTLQQIAYDVVEVLGYSGAMVATYEQGDALPVRALYVDPSFATQEQISRWEAEVSRYSEEPVSITNPEIARVHVYDEQYKDNLSVRAFQAGGPVTSDDLYDLFTPIAPPVSRPVVQGIQQALGVRQVVAIPFFLEVAAGDETEREFVGNLFAAKKAEISEQDVRVLSAFARQAAVAIESELRRLQVEITQRIVFEMQASLSDENQILQHIVQGVVTDLGYVGAMVATYEPDDSLPVRALYLDPQIASPERIGDWEKELTGFSGSPANGTDSVMARVYVHRDECSNNLGVRAFKAGGPVASGDLYDLFRPVAPLASKPMVEGIQRSLGVKQVIAVPFFLQTPESGQPEIVGNLFAVTRSRRFTSDEVELLQAFGQQAAAGIRNAQLYREAEERRQIAQIFGKMAFSAAAFVHALKNHLGAFRMHLHLLKVAPPDKQDQISAMGEQVDNRLKEAIDILDHLHEPWLEAADVPTDVNHCLNIAIDSVVGDRDKLEAEKGISVRVAFGDDLAPVLTSHDMLTEAFRVLISRGLQMARQEGRGGVLRIESHAGLNSGVEVVVADNGSGIKFEDLPGIFELRRMTGTEEAEGGFGLFWTKEYVEGLGGSITVESDAQGGTAFRLWFPTQIE